MAKKYGKYRLLVAVAVIVLALVGVVVYATLNDDESAQSGQRSTSDNCKEFSGKQYCTADYVGLGKAEATSKAEGDGLVVRVVSTDEELPPKTGIADDLQSKRVNFTIRNGVVTKAEFY